MRIAIILALHFIGVACVCLWCAERFGASNALLPLGLWFLLVSITAKAK
jgi:hypothetical protein